MRVVSLSLDADIAVDDGEARRRQRRYADHFDSYTVIVKTAPGEGSHVQEGSLRVEPTRSSSRYAYLYDAYQLASEEIRRNGADVLTVQDPFAVGLVGWLLKRRHGVRLHTQVHTDFLNNPVWRSISWENRIFDRLGRFVLPRADVIRVGTDYERKKVTEFVPDDVSVHVAPVRMDFDTVVHDGDGTGLRSELGVGDRPVVLFAGRFVPAKDLDRWLEVASRVAESETIQSPPAFVLVGDGPHFNAIRDRAESDDRLADLTWFPGWVPSGEIAQYYDMADVFLLTSRYEGTSRVLVEAGMNELPVVATPFAGSHDNVEHGVTGFVSEDVAELASYVATLLEDRTKRERFGERSRRHLEERFDPDTLVEQYIAFLSDVW